MRKPTSERLKEVNELADWCEFVVRAVHGIRTPSETNNKEFLSQMLEMELDILKKARARVDLRGLRMVYRDRVEMIEGLNLHHRQTIDRLLKERFGRGLDIARGKIERQVRAILKRGVIQKADEFRILQVWIEMTLDDPSKKADIDGINALLGTVTEPLPE